MTGLLHILDDSCYPSDSEDYLLLFVFANKTLTLRHHCDLLICTFRRQEHRIHKSSDQNHSNSTYSHHKITVAGADGKHLNLIVTVTAKQTLN
jgi:hypothetical protein